MNLQANTGVDEKEQWRERIMRALQDLRGCNEALTSRMQTDDRGDDASVDSVA